MSRPGKSAAPARPASFAFRLTLLILGLLVVLLVLLLLIFAGKGASADAADLLALPETVTPSAQTAAVTPAATEDPDRLILSNLTPTPAASGEWLDTWPAASSVETVHDSSALIAALKGRSQSSQALQGVTVFVDPGHGGQDSGTVYPQESPYEAVEKEVNLAVGLKLKSALEALGASVIMTRTDDSWVSVYSRAAQVGQTILDQVTDSLKNTGKDLSQFESLKTAMTEIQTTNLDEGGGGILGGLGSGADARLLYDTERQFPEYLFLSLHCNYSDAGADIGGLQIYYVDNAYNYEFTRDSTADGYDLPPVYQYFNDEGRKKLVDCLQSAIIRQLPELTTTGGPQTILQEGFVVLNRMGIDSALVEMGFFSNADDRVLLLSDSGQTELAQALAQSVYSYYCE
ncbi:N-acetylmuramoyl-L-alanine amidase [Oscillospiraceae bacterium HV4-5-C5C]|nr:N-acetylmuramoyl-L-alanine amidase [Oscillospiraceae bacterium HV4-5-C5C]